MEENFKIETDLFSLIKRESDENKIIKAIVDYGIDKPLKGGTAFYFSVTYNKPNVAKFLINKKINVNALFDGHYTALMSAIDENNIDMVKLLLENEANVNLKDKRGNDALWKGVFNYNFEIVKLLVDAGADPFKADNPENYSNYDGAVDLMPATEEIVKYFDRLK